MHSETSSAQFAQPQNVRTAAATRARTKHGMYSKYPVILDEDPDTFVAFRKRYQEDWNAHGVTEEEMVDELAAAQWKLNRSHAEEEGMYIVFEKAQPPAEEATYCERVALAVCDSSMNKKPIQDSRTNNLQLTRKISRIIRDLMLLQKERPKEERRGGKQRANPAPVGENGDTGEASQSDVGSGRTAKFGDRGAEKPTPPPPGAPPSALDPKHLTAWQQECEDLEAEDNRMRAILDRAVRGKVGEG